MLKVSICLDKVSFEEENMGMGCECLVMLAASLLKANASE